MVINEEFWKHLQNLPDEVVKDGDTDSGMLLVRGMLDKGKEIESMVRFMHTEHYDPAEFTFALGEMVMYLAKLSDRFGVEFHEILFYLQTAVYVQIEKSKEVEDGE